MCRRPGRFAGGAGSSAAVEGEWKRTTSNTSLPSGHAEILNLKGDSYRLKDKDPGFSPPANGSSE